MPEDGEQGVARVQQPEFDHDDVIWIQQRLKDLGYYNGPVDGSVGQVTRGAIKEYQRDQDVTASGVPSAELREFMWRNGG
jgi:peptidoglycan hydrolase-like protein with peptidoglycan-binding domain